MFSSAVDAVIGRFLLMRTLAVRSGATCDGHSGISAFYHDSAAAWSWTGSRRGRAGGALHEKEARPDFPALGSLLPRRSRARGLPISTTSRSTKSRSPSSSGCWKPIWPSRGRLSQLFKWRSRSGQREDALAEDYPRGARRPTSPRGRRSSSPIITRPRASAFFPSPFDEARDSHP